MPNEAGKALSRLRGLLVGKGLDIGCGPDPILDTCDRWDVEHGDAQVLAGVPDNTYDWVFSSHLLEHLKDPTAALARWWRTLKVGGYLIFLVPDEDLYEQGNWPPKFNIDHKVTFTPSKFMSWSPVSHNVVNMLQALHGHHLISLTIQDNGYDYTKHGEDQTAHGDAEVSIQCIVRKCPVKDHSLSMSILDTHYKYESS